MVHYTGESGRPGGARRRVGEAVAGSRGVVAAWLAAEAWAVAVPGESGWARRAERDFGAGAVSCILSGARLRMLQGVYCPVEELRLSELIEWRRSRAPGQRSFRKN